VQDIRKILIANRGEIALRIQRAAHEMGIATVAVFSDADRDALHVLEADEAYRLGPAPANESYLRLDRMIEIADRSGADAIHPGYGFLSENAEFAEACQNAGVKFIGPTAAAMRRLGSKIMARHSADACHLPRVPGSVDALSSIEQARALAEEIRYPVILKAVAGGGGKGMRVVSSAQEMESAYLSAQSESLRAFGSGDIYLERFVQRPRHIEIQIIADEHGNCVSLGERECSMQRRHQKVLEEAPSAVLSEELRRQMGEAAVRLALSANYSNAGTVEFLLDEDQKFYFLEMNTRLQVEHPVTELVTGLDLVQLQIRIAEGEELPIKQADVQFRGHAIECRIYAEDPDNGFFPSPGKITRLLQPSGAGIREDCGIYEGYTVPIEYDPLLSKLIAYAPTRELAIERMLRALEEYVICGIRSNLSLFRRILNDEDFRAGRIDTGSLDRLLEKNGTSNTTGNTQSALEKSDQADAAVIAAAIFQHLRKQNGSPHNGAFSRWKLAARNEGLRP
jgi:acetyl-CoA carboxylase, biotin carboxylase subunit